MRITKIVLALVLVSVAVTGRTGDSAPFRLDTIEGTRVARAIETISYSTEWDNVGKVLVAVDGVTLKEASAPASGDVVWNVAKVGGGYHTITHTTYVNGAVRKVETAIFQTWGFCVDDLPPEIRASLTYDANGFMIYEGWVLDYQNKDVAKLTVPEGVVGIGRNALADMWGLQTLTLPKSLKHIVEGAFRNCYILDNVVIPDAVETIGDEAFMNCTELQSIAFGTGLKLIGDSAFENCISISSIVFKEGLRIIGDRAFAGPMRLMSVSLPASLESIGEDAFSGSAYITGVTAPMHLKAMSDLFPDSYVTLVSAVVPDGVTNTVGWAFAGCASLTGVTLPDTLVAVGECAFSNCASLAEIGLPNSVVTLGVGAFSCCTNLHTVALSKNLEAIRDRTFEKCPMLDSLVVPASVKSVGANIYSGANVWYGRYSWSYNFVASLTGVYFLGNAPVMDDSAYSGMPDEMSSYVIKGSTGWYLTGSPTLPPGGWPTCNTRAITYWSPNRFSVTFDANGGQPATYAAEQITDTTYSLPKTNPTRNGFRFMGWWTEKTAGAQVTPNTRVTLTKEHTLYAHWQMTSNAMAVQFNPNGGTVQPDFIEYPIGDTYGSLPVPTRIGHRFLGWYTSHVGGVLVTEASEVQRENNELYAHWSPIIYLVRFHANGGTGTMADQTFTYDVRQALATHTFARTGFAFSGWATTPSGQVRYAERANVENLAEIQGHVVDLYAVWSGAGYSVRFDSNGGTGLMGNQTIAVGETQNLRLCEFERAGYVFAGWAVSPTDAAAKKVTYFDGQTVRNLATMNGADVPLYAVWVLEGQTVRITFNPNGGSVSPTTRAVTVGLTVGTLPIPVRTGFTFAGWYTAATGGTQMTAETVVTGNVTYYAQWKVNGPIVTFNANGGTVAEGTRTVGKGKAVGTLPKSVRTGYTFKGWYTKKSGGTKIKTTTKVTKSVTYYAQWTANKYTIKFNANGGKGTMKPLSATYGKSVALRANAFKRTYWTFLGWAKTKGATAVDCVNKQKVKNLTSANGKTVTLYAVWRRNTYTVRFSANGGTGELLPQTVSCGAKTALATNGFTRAGFRFAGWTTKKGGKVVYKNAAAVKDLAKSGKSVTLYAVWYPESWAVGTFKGTGTIGGSAATVTLTVGSTGSISGKFVLANKKAYSFKAAAFTEFEEGALRVATTIAYGKKTCELDIAVAQVEETGATVAELLVIYAGAEYGGAALE